MKAIHAVNAVLYGSQVSRLMCHRQTNKKPTDYYTRGRPRAPRVTNQTTIPVATHARLG